MIFVCKVKYKTKDNLKVIINLVNQQSQPSGGFLVILNEVPSTGTLEQHSLDALVGKHDYFGLLMFSLELITLELQRCMVIRKMPFAPRRHAAR
jgi:hypothetical protein